jgi:Sulfotransferase domain
MIFNLSPHRMGTRSFTQFFADHGFTALHWQDALDPVAEDALRAMDTELLWGRVAAGLGDHVVASDLPWPTLFRHAAYVYPRARFVITLCDVDAWIASTRRHTRDRDLSYLEKFFYWYICRRQRPRLCD